MGDSFFSGGLGGEPHGCQNHRECVQPRVSIRPGIHHCRDGTCTLVSVHTLHSGCTQGQRCICEYHNSHHFNRVFKHILFSSFYIQRV